MRKHINTNQSGSFFIKSIYDDIIKPTQKRS